MSAQPANILRQKLELYWQTVVDTMAEGLFIVDTQGVVVFINPAAQRLTGYGQDEVLGHTCDIFESETCMVCRQARGRRVCRLFEDGQVANQRCAIKAKDGTQVHILKNAHVLKDEVGRVIGGVETLTDITALVEKDRQIKGLRRELSRDYGFEGLLGDSPPMRELFQLLQSAATSEAPVLLLGESGTGKELAAAAIHRRGQRQDGPFIKVNCAALNESLLESELFGHEKGAFTGADRVRKGRFEAAAGGTIFLDEIGDLPPAVQVKLLRVLQEKEIERVGSHQPRPVDVRVVSATNRDLPALMRQGLFREDLFYRINVIPIHLPPLRQRREEIPLLARTFLERAALASGREITGISPAALDRLMAHDWPGNVRELINAIEYALVTCRQGEVQPRHLPPRVLGRACSPGGLVGASPAPVPVDADQERRLILDALARTQGNKTQAAAQLGISRVTLWKRLKRLGIQA